MSFNIYDLIGGLGASITIVAYFATQQGWLQAGDRRFPLANLVGASLIFVSLLHDWNLPSVVIEIFWFAISLWGLVRPRKAGLH